MARSRSGAAGAQSARAADVGAGALRGCGYRLDDQQAIVSAVRQGFGIGLAPVWIFEEDLRAGRVKALLPEHPLPAAEVHLVCLERRLLAKRTRIFIETTDTAFAGNAGLQPGYLEGLWGVRRLRCQRSALV
ncbi:MAG: LysR substrate-binding domain-containing protein [Vitreoscilla sp.]